MHRFVIVVSIYLALLNILSTFLVTNSMYVVDIAIISINAIQNTVDEIILTWERRVHIRLCVFSMYETT